MAAKNFQMAIDQVNEPRAAAAQPEWKGLGWNDSSWELMRGLDVIEDLPPDAWPDETA